MARPMIFLSYAREDANEVDKLYEALIDSGTQPWMDRRDLLPGQDWEIAIKLAIRQAQIVVVCLSSKAAGKRGFLQKEIKQAQLHWEEKLSEDIYIIPTRLEPCEVPDSLSRFQWVDLFEEGGFHRLLSAVRVADEQSREATVQRKTFSEPQIVIPSQRPRLFHYISKTKVETLLPQFDPDNAYVKDEPLVRSVSKLVAHLEQQGLARRLGDEQIIQTTSFLFDTDVWRQGLFYFQTMVSTTVAYFMWKQHGDVLIVLAGSPDHLIGKRIASEGMQISSTGDAIDSIGTMSLLETINAEEMSSVVLRSGRTSHKIPAAAKEISVSNQKAPLRLNQRVKDIYTHLPEIEIAIFCLQHLSNLMPWQIETCFRPYVTFRCKGDTLLQDLRAEFNEGQKGKHSILYDGSRLEEAERIGLGNFRTVCVGSPLYTAVG